MLSKVMNWKNIQALPVVLLLSMPFIFGACGEVEDEDEEAATVEITTCLEVPLVGGTVAVTVAGTVRANENIKNIEIIAKSNGSTVGTAYLDNLSTGESKDFSITGTISRDKDDLSCEVEASWLETSWRTN